MPSRAKKSLPEGELIGQMERRGQADGDPAAGFPPLCGAEDAPAFLEEVEAGGVVVHELLDIVVAAAQKAEGDLSPVHIGDGDLAAVVAETADLRGDGDRFPVEAEAAEAAPRDPRIGHQERDPPGAGEMAEFRDMDRPAQALLERGDKSAVLRRRSLEKNRLSDGRLHGDLGQIVLRDRMECRGKDLVDAVPGVEIMVDVPFHEHGAAVARDRGAPVLRPRRVIGERAAEALGLLLEKAPRSRGADIVHDGEGDGAVLERGELRVLPADLDDRVRVGSQLNGGAGVGGDLIDDQVRAEDLPDEFSAGAGRSRTEDR